MSNDIPNKIDLYNNRIRSNSTGHLVYNPSNHGDCSEQEMSSNLNQNHNSSSQSEDVQNHISEQSDAQIKNEAFQLLNSSRRSSQVSLKRSSQSRSPPPPMTLDNINVIAESLKLNLENDNYINGTLDATQGHDDLQNNSSDQRTDQALAQAVVNAIIMQNQSSTSRSVIRRSGSAATSYMASDEDNNEDDEGYQLTHEDAEKEASSLNKARKKRHLKVKIPSQQESCKTATSNDVRQESSGYGASTFSITSSGRSSVGLNLISQQQSQNGKCHQGSRTVRIADTDVKGDNSDREDNFLANCKAKTAQRSSVSTFWPTTSKSLEQKCPTNTPSTSQEQPEHPCNNWSRIRRSLPSHLHLPKNSLSSTLNDNNPEDLSANPNDTDEQFSAINQIRSNSLNGNSTYFQHHHVANHSSRHHKNKQACLKSCTHMTYDSDHPNDEFSIPPSTVDTLLSKVSKNNSPCHLNACYCSASCKNDDTFFPLRDDKQEQKSCERNGKPKKSTKSHRHGVLKKKSCDYVHENNATNAFTAVSPTLVQSSLCNQSLNRMSPSSEDGYESIMVDKKNYLSKDSIDFSPDHKFSCPDKYSRPESTCSTNGFHSANSYNGYSRKASLILDNNRFQIDVNLLKNHPDTMLGRMFTSEFDESRRQSTEDIYLTNHLGISSALFSTILDYYRTGRMSCPSDVNIQDLKEACDFFLIPFNHNTVRCGNIRAFLHELSNEGAYQLFERFLEQHILPKLVECTRLGERECHLVILMDDEFIDWDDDFPPQLPDDEMNSHLIYNTQMMKFLKYIENREIAKQVLGDRGLKKIRIGIEGYPTNKERIKYRAGIRSEIIYNYAQRPFIRMSWEEEENKSRHVDFQCVKSKSVNDLTNVDSDLVEPIPTVSAVALAASDLLQSDDLILNQDVDNEAPPPPQQQQQQNPFISTTDGPSLEDNAESVELSNLTNVAAVNVPNSESIATTTQEEITLQPEDDSPITLPNQSSDQ